MDRLKMQSICLSLGTQFFEATLYANLTSVILRLKVMVTLKPGVESRPVITYVHLSQVDRVA